MYEVPASKRPRGAPKIGAKITMIDAFTDEDTYTGTVVAYLSTQFVVELANGARHVLKATGGWKNAA